MPTNKKPCVVAGLMATLGIGAALVAVPVTALADEGVSIVPAAGHETVTEGAVVSSEGGDGLAPLTDEKPSIDSGSLNENVVVNESQTDPADPSTPAQGTDKTETTSSGEGSTSSDSTTMSSLESESPTVIGQVATNITSNVGTLAPTSVANDPLAMTDVFLPDSSGAEIELPKIGWDGNSYWDGTVNEDGTAKKYTGWVVDDHEGEGLQRYWIKDGVKFTNDWFSIGDGTFGYALDSWVLRGQKWIGDLLYIANNDGVLLADGWHVTDLGDGVQRYYVESDSHAIRKGYSDSTSNGGWAHYTTDAGYVLRGAGYGSDGHMYYADNDGRLKSSGWVVTDGFDQGLQRYWFENDRVADRGVHKTGPSSWTYVRPEGYVLLNRFVDGKNVYLADNDGNLLGGAKGGWVLSDSFGHGLQRYWIDPAKHAAVVGYDGGSEHVALGNWAHYTTDAGYVLRGAGYGSDGHMYYADNDGKVTVDGWVVTGGFTGGQLQRYYAGKDGYFLADTLLDPSVYNCDYWAYVDENGKALRGAIAAPLKYGVEDAVYLADNDGRFVSQPGWLVTGDYDGGTLQRYWIAQALDGYCYAQTGEFTALLSGISSSFYGRPGYGYVYRGKQSMANGVLLADNEGRLAEVSDEAGFIVTGEYDNGVVQRYFLKRHGGVYYAQTGRIDFQDKHYFGLDIFGYVLRGKLRYGDGMLLADNDGVLEWNEGWLVTDKYDGSLQRYRIDNAPGGGLMGARIGAFTVDGNDYYGREDAGYVVIGLYIAPSGKAYYGDNNGVLTTIPLSQVALNLWNRIKNVSSVTQYLIAVDCENCHTVVFQGSAGNWTPIFDWLCGVGLPWYNNGQGTIRGEWTIGGDNAYCNWTDDPDFSEWGNPYDYQTRYFAKDDIKWYTNFCLDLGFHSTIGWDGGYSDPNQVGKKISHGCIRLMEWQAEWIYFNATYGTKVVTI